MTALVSSILLGRGVVNTANFNSPATQLWLCREQHRRSKNGMAVAQWKGGRSHDHDTESGGRELEGRACGVAKSGKGKLKEHG